jgi:hypothetical protein
MCFRTAIVMAAVLLALTFATGQEKLYSREEAELARTPGTHPADEEVKPRQGEVSK